MALVVDVDRWLRTARYPTSAVVWKEALKKEAKRRESLGQLISFELGA